MFIICIWRNSINNIYVMVWRSCDSLIVIVIVYYYLFDIKGAFCCGYQMHWSNAIVMRNSRFEANTRSVVLRLTKVWYRNIANKWNRPGMWNSFSDTNDSLSSTLLSVQLEKRPLKNSMHTRTRDAQQQREMVAICFIRGNIHTVMSFIFHEFWMLRLLYALFAYYCVLLVIIYLKEIGYWYWNAYWRSTHKFSMNFYELWLRNH